MKKSNLKSIRLTDKVMDYIIAYRGNGFNEKFENIILDAMESEEKRKKELERYDELINRARKRYQDMCDELRSLEPMVQACLHVNSRIKLLDKEFAECITKMCPDSWNLQQK